MELEITIARAAADRPIAVTIVGKYTDRTTKTLTPAEARQAAADLIAAADRADAVN